MNGKKILVIIIALAILTPPTSAGIVIKRHYTVLTNDLRARKGGKYRVNMLPTTVHIYFGRVTGATADGRKAGEPVSDGISPTHGADKYGPTAVIKSAAKIDHSRTGGTLLNQKLLPSLLNTDEDIEKLLKLVRSYFKLGGHHIQFNVIDQETLMEAQRKPENYRDLIVRVAGYSDYFVDIGKELQDEIILRTTRTIF